MDPDTDIHETFLDAYTPSGAVGVHSNATEYLLGENADYAEHYWSDDAKTGIRGNTDSCLPQAYNVEITDAYEADLGSKGHDWPFHWYSATTTNPAAPYAHGHGFSLSWEAGGDPLVKNGSCTAIPESTPDEVTLYVSTPPVAESIDFSGVMSAPSDSESFIITPTYFILDMTSSASLPPLSPLKSLSSATGTAAWIEFFVPVTQACNAVYFDFAFQHTAGSENVVSVHWNDEMIGSIDERYFEPAAQSVSLMLPDTYLLGTHSMGFRIDTFAAPASGVMVSNLTFGFISSITPPVITNIVLSEGEDSSVRISMSSIKGLYYSCSCSSNLIDWLSCGSHLQSSEDTIVIETTNATGVRSGFYRGGAEWQE